MNQEKTQNFVLKMSGLAKFTVISYWPINNIVGICLIFSEFKDRDYCCFSLSIWEILRLPQIIQE